MYGLTRLHGLVGVSEFDPLPGQLGGVDVARLGLEQQVDGTFAGPVPRPELLLSARTVGGLSHFQLLTRPR